MNPTFLRHRQWLTTAAILGAVAMGLVATDFRAIAVENREPGIAGITKGRPALTVPADVPAGETRWYGVGFAFQVGPGLAGLLCNRHIDDAGDHEDGSDLILFDKLGGDQGGERHSCVTQRDPGGPENRAARGCHEVHDAWRFRAAGRQAVRRISPSARRQRFWDV